MPLQCIPMPRLFTLDIGKHGTNAAKAQRLKSNFCGGALLSNLAGGVFRKHTCHKSLFGRLRTSVRSKAIGCLWRCLAGFCAGHQTGQDGRRLARPLEICRRTAFLPASGSGNNCTIPASELIGLLGHRITSRRTVKSSTLMENRHHPPRPFHDTSPL